MQKHHKWILFGVVVLTCLVADQVTKMWASERLANRTPNPALIDGPHHMKVTVPASYAGKTVEVFLADELTGTKPDQVETIARRYTYEGVTPIPYGHELRGGEVLTIKQRQVTVIDGYFDFRYTRNPGAAFGFLSNEDGDFRRPFFVTVSIIAIIVIILIFRKTPTDQKLLLWSLSLIVGGAAGNLVDRVLYGWVIDFIDWHYLDEYHWPTFNIADSAISIGVALMALEIIVGFKTTEPEGDKKPESEAKPKQSGAEEKA